MTNIIQLSDHRPKPEPISEMVQITHDERGESVLSTTSDDDTIKMLKRAILIIKARGRSGK